MLAALLSRTPLARSALGPWLPLIGICLTAAVISNSYMVPRWFDLPTDDVVAGHFMLLYFSWAMSLYAIRLCHDIGNAAYMARTLKFSHNGINFLRWFLVLHLAWHSSSEVAGRPGKAVYLIAVVLLIYLGSRAMKSVVLAAAK